MKTKITFFGLLVSSFICAQEDSNTQTRDDAGAITTQSGFYETSNPTNYPSGATGWWHLLDVRHSHPENNYGMQFSGSAYDQDLWFRKTANSATTEWNKIVMENPSGNIILKNRSNTTNAGNKIQFYPYLDNPYGPYIKSNLHYGNGTASRMSLKLGSYWNGEKNELTLMNGSVGVGVSTPTRTLSVNGDIYAIGTSSLSFQDDTRFTVTSSDISTLSSSSVSMPYYGILTPNASGTAELWISGDAGIRMFTEGSPTPKFTLAKTGNAALLGKFEAQEIKVTLTPTADFVFEENYNLPKLKDVEKFIKENKHLPEVASAKVMEKEGVNVGEFQIKLLQKIEELTLYVIEQNNKIKSLEAKIENYESKK